MTSRLAILGCSGGIGRGLKTTSFLWDGDVLIDAGTGVCDLELEAMQRIDDIVLTHSHLDHVLGVALIADAVGARRSSPIRVHARIETLEALRRHLFADALWPDFTQLPSPERPFLTFHTLAPDGRLAFSGGRVLEAMPAAHLVPAIGVHLRSTSGSLVFTGDTGPNPAFWQQAARTQGLRHVITETSFPDSARALALSSKHYCPSLLAEDLRHFEDLDTCLYISHLKPGSADRVMTELRERLAPRRVIDLSTVPELEF
jgi:3',5'-cyclic-nucleotide phosphodiesterase